MEREQIIKALEICANYKGCSDCKDCPLHNDEYVQCEQNVLEGLSLSLINELTEENDRLSTALAEYEYKTNIRISEEYVHNEAYEELREENERLTKKIEMSEAAYQGLQSAFSVCANQVKADTVKEMQEVVKERIHKSVHQYWNECSGGYYLAEDVDDDIDQTAKEMLESEK